MSYDLEVRSDDAYSESQPRDRAVAVLQRLGARPSGSRTQMLYDDPEKGHRIEIDLGNEDGGDPDKVNFVGFGVPYAFLASTGRKMLELAFALASDLGWRMYDPQAGRYFDSGDKEAALASQGAAGDAVDRISGLPLPEPRGFASRVLGRFVRQTKFMLVVAAVTFGMIGAYAAWNASERPRPNPRPFVGTVLASSWAVLLLRPLILELLEPSRS